MTSIVVGTYTTLPHHVTKRRPLRRVPAVAQSLRNHSNSAGITLTSWPSSVAPPLEHRHHVSPPPSYDSEKLVGVLLILERNLEKVVGPWSRLAGQMLGLACSVSQLVWRSSHHPFINWLAQHSVQHQLEILIPTAYPLNQLRAGSSWSTATSRSWVVSIPPLDRCSSLNLAGSTRVTVYSVVPYINKNRHRSSHHFVLLL